MKTRLLLLLLSVWCSCGYGQTIIGEDLDFADPDQKHTLVTKRGDQFLGHLHWLSNDSLGFQIASLPDTTVFQLAAVEYVGLLGTQPVVYRDLDAAFVPDYADDPRYSLPFHLLNYSATALPYAGKGSYKNTMLAVNQVDFTPNEHLGITVGAFIPAIFMIKVRAHVSLSDIIHVGGAWHQYLSVFDQDSRLPSHPYAVLTVGDHKKYINITYGFWMYNDNNSFFDQENFPLITLGASYAFSNRWRFFAEAAALFSNESPQVYPTFFLSNHKRQRTLDFGLFAIPQSVVGIFPGLSYTFLF
ncbi:MAG: hypothetical protein AAGJ82_02820 [Bacteroidota bacterium]